MSKTRRINTLFQNKNDAGCITVRNHSIAHEYSEGNNCLILIVNFLFFLIGILKLSSHFRTYINKTYYMPLPSQTPQFPTVSFFVLEMSLILVCVK